MPSLGMKGPWKLDANTIDTVVTRNTAGNYALGHTGVDGAFYVSYVGRSDDDLHGRLLKHVGKYSHFMAVDATSPKAAFEKECQNYHDFTPPDNKIHPGRPEGSGWSCPVCRIFDS